MKLIIHPQSKQEADFLKEMLERMGITYGESQKEEETPQSNLPYIPTEGITHPQIPDEPIFRNLEDMPELPEPNKPYTTETAAMLDEIGGIWADEEETLDDLLNQLTQ